MILSVLSAFISTIGFAIFFHVRQTHLLICGTIGAIGWLIYLLLNGKYHSAVLASFIAALVVTALSYLLAKKRKTPITVFLVTGIIPLVPGLGL